MLVVGDEEAECDVLIAALHQAGYTTDLVRGAAAACAALRRSDFDAVLADLPAPDVDAFAILRASRRRSPAPRVVFLLPATPLGAEPLLPSLRGEAFDCLRHPLAHAAIADRLAAAVAESRAEERALAVSRVHGARAPMNLNESRADRWGQLLTTLADPVIGPEDLVHVAVAGARSATAAVDAWVYAPGPAAGDASCIAHAGGAGDQAAVVAASLGRETRTEGRPLSIVVGSAEDAAAGTYEALPLPGIDGIRALVLYFAAGSALAAEDRPLLAAAAAHLGRRLSGSGDGAVLGDGDPTVDYIVQALAGALALHDAATEEHSRRVGAFASDLALAAGLPPSSAELRDIERAALLHDIGKLAVGKELLRKRAPLTALEALELRDHPLHGYQVLREIPGLQGAAAMIHAAHEHWDGRGYPRRLAGEQIPLGARIVLVADTWDTMTAGRPYRSPVGAEAAAREIRGLAGAQFDPLVVRAFEQVVARWSALLGAEPGAVEPQFADGWRRTAA